jgi:hypothetical protein
MLIESTPFWADVEQEAINIVALSKQPENRHISPRISELKVIPYETAGRFDKQMAKRMQGSVFVISVKNRQAQTIDGRVPGGRWRVFPTSLFMAAQMLVNQTARLATPEEIEHFHADNEAEKARIAGMDLQRDITNHRAVLPGVRFESAPAKA